MTEKSKGQWVRLSPRDIYLRFLEIEEWRKKAEKAFGFTHHWLDSVQTKILNDDEKGMVKNLLEEILKKTSAPCAYEVMTKISKVFGLKDLSGFCTQQKFTGLLGVNHVVNLALSSVFSALNLKKGFANFGGVSIDYSKICKLGVPEEMHNVIQEKINLGDVETNTQLRVIFEQIRALHENKMYPFQTFKSLGEVIKSLTDEDPMGYMFYQINICFPKKVEKDFNFYSNEIVKSDGGFFQDLCILILSYEFPKQNQSNSVNQ
ncbi:MAG: hypothetical protein ACOYMB_02595 [Patescibacteria group bacterium]